jgi:hypothetical protein
LRVRRIPRWHRTIPAMRLSPMPIEVPLRSMVCRTCAAWSAAASSRGSVGRASSSCRIRRSRVACGRRSTARSG